MRAIGTIVGTTVPSMPVRVDVVRVTVAFVPATIGIVTGSSAEFYFTQAAEVVGLQIGKDVVLKNMPPAEQLLMVKGIGAVVPWEPSVTIITDER